MMHEKYNVQSSDDFLSHDFVSEGPRGMIKKRIQFQDITETMYNVGFGDLNDDGIDSTIVTNNGDHKKVLTTVCSTIIEFLERYPAATIVITGASRARMRLYRMAILKMSDTVDRNFEIIGNAHRTTRLFERDKDYESLSIKRKL